MVKRFSLNISKYFFLILFLEFLGSITFFNHSHPIDGYTIVHSHPFKTPHPGAPLHNHTANGFQLLNFLSDFSAIVLFVLFVDQIFLLLRRLNHDYIRYFSCQQFLKPNSQRGPPQLMLFRIF